MSKVVFSEIEKFISTHQCPAIIQYDGQLLINGSAEFVQEKNTYQ